MNIAKKLLAAACTLCIATSAASKEVSFTFTVDTSGLETTNAILQVGMYAQHGNGNTASAIWDDIELTGPQSFTDDFDNRTVTDERIGNDWTWYDTAYDSLDCSGDSSGGFGPYSENGGGAGNYNAVNNNYARHGDSGGEYFRAGLQSAGDGLALEVYHNQYAAAACTRVQIFKEFNVAKASLDGSYTLTATAVENQYTAIAEGNEVGVFYKIISVDTGYSIADSDSQTEFYTRRPATVGGSSGRDVTAVPALPLGGLLALVALLGWLGARYRF